MTRYRVWLVKPDNYEHAEALREVAEVVSEALFALGLGGGIFEIPRDFGRWVDRHSGTTPIVLGAHLCFDLPPDAIIYNSEQVGSPWFTGRYCELLRTHEVWDYDATNAARFASLGLPVPRVVPIGYMPILERVQPGLQPGDAATSIDVLFYGALNDRRSRVLSALAQRGVTVKHMFGVYGCARDHWIARSKLVLNMHFYDQQIFEAVRVSYLLANGRCVLSETPIDPAYEHVLAWAPYDDLVDTALALLGDDGARRAALGEAGAALMRARPMTTILAAALGGPRRTAEEW